MLLVKFPTRERPLHAYRTILKYIELSRTLNVRYQITFDDNDIMAKPGTLELFRNMSHLVTCIGGHSISKIHACNRNIPTDEWTIIVLASDDMICQKEGWDEIIIEQMQKHFPDYDGVLHFNDGYLGEKLNTLCIMGRKYFDRFGYIYHPTYFSLWADNEFTEVSRKLNRMKYFPEVLFKHEHPSWSAQPTDDLYRKNEKYFTIDQRNFEKRRQINFGLNVLTAE